MEQFNDVFSLRQFPLSFLLLSTGGFAFVESGHIETLCNCCSLLLE